MKESFQNVDMETIAGVGTQTEIQSQCSNGVVEPMFIHDSYPPLDLLIGLLKCIMSYEMNINAIIVQNLF